MGEPSNPCLRGKTDVKSVMMMNDDYGFQSTEPWRIFSGLLRPIFLDPGYCALFLD